VIGAAVLALAATSVAGMMFVQRRLAPAVLKFAVFQPENTSYPGMSSVSPDGRYLTFSAVGPEGKRMLWLRPLERYTPHSSGVRKAHRLLSGRPIASRLPSLQTGS